MVWWHLVPPPPHSPISCLPNIASANILPKLHHHTMDGSIFRYTQSFMDNWTVWTVSYVNYFTAAQSGWAFTHQWTTHKYAHLLAPKFTHHRLTIGGKVPNFRTGHIKIHCNYLQMNPVKRTITHTNTCLSCQYTCVGSGGNLKSSHCLWLSLNDNQYNYENIIRD